MPIPDELTLLLDEYTDSAILMGYNDHAPDTVKEFKEAQTKLITYLEDKL